MKRILELYIPIINIGGIFIILWFLAYFNVKPQSPKLTYQPKDSVKVNVYPARYSQEVYFQTKKSNSKNDNLTVKFLN